jgi:hypothetical protein
MNVCVDAVPDFVGSSFGQLQHQKNRIIAMHPIYFSPARTLIAIIAHIIGLL